MALKIYQGKAKAGSKAQTSAKGPKKGVPEPATGWPPAKEKVAEVLLGILKKAKKPLDLAELHDRTAKGLPGYDREGLRTVVYILLESDSRGLRSIGHNLKATNKKGTIYYTLAS